MTGRALALEAVRRARTLREEAGITQPDTGGHCIHPIATRRADVLCRIRDKRLGRLQQHEDTVTALTASNSQGGAQTFEKAPLLPKGAYTLRLRRISEPRTSSLPAKVDPKTLKPIPNRDYVFVDYTILGGEHDGKEWSEIASWTLGLGPAGPSKLRQIMEGFLGHELQDGERCDPHDIAAQQPEAEVVVEQKPREDGTKKNVTGSFIRVTKPYVPGAAPVADDAADLDEVPF